MNYLRQLLKDANYTVKGHKTITYSNADITIFENKELGKILYYITESKNYCETFSYILEDITVLEEKANLLYQNAK